MEITFDIFQIYGQYCAITSTAIAHVEDGCNPDEQLERGRFLKEALSQMLKVVEPKFTARVSLFDELCKLMSKLEFLKADFFEFSRFYDFVFFMCRENGQKSITVTRAIMAWRMTLAGRFRLLNEWCDFVEKNQRHNISEDTWRQLLAFSSCVNENLEGYDPQGAWPILIDDFVDYLYRVRGYHGPPTFLCSCIGTESQPLSSIMSGLANSSASKRKLEDDLTTSPSDEINVIAKRRTFRTVGKCATLGLNPPSGEPKHRYSSSPSGSTPVTTMCAIEGCLSRGFAGLLSGSSCIHFDPTRRLSYT